MAKQDPAYRIDPIEPGEVAPRFSALLDRLGPVLQPADAAELQGLVDAGDLPAAFARLDAITNDGTVAVDTATLVEFVLLGQAIRAG
jgi:hypothetical protein